VPCIFTRVVCLLLLDVAVPPRGPAGTHARLTLGCRRSGAAPPGSSSATAAAWCWTWRAPGGWSWACLLQCQGVAQCWGAGQLQPSPFFCLCYEGLCGSFTVGVVGAACRHQQVAMEPPQHCLDQFLVYLDHQCRSVLPSRQALPTLHGQRVAQSIICIV
jgi:hypothetical protein